MKEETEKFIRSVSDGDTGEENINRRIMSVFEAAGKPPEGARERVLASVSKRRSRVKTAAILVPALACSFLAVFILLHRETRRPVHETEEYSADWLSYENFPYYKEEAKNYLNDTEKNGDRDYFHPSAETGM